MGLFFNLFIETGSNKKGNLDLKEYFLSIGEIKTQFGTHKMKIGSVENDLGISVSVDETGWTGLERPNEKEIATEVRYEFYKLLQYAPKFRYAMVGVEAAEWVDGQDILDEKFDGYLPSHGLVFNNELAKIMKKELIPFKKGYGWIPYEGEINRSY